MFKGFIFGCALAIAAVAASDLAHANPAPREVTGALNAGARLVVSGSGFGSRGPQIVLYEDFDSVSPGSAVTHEGPFIGRWNSMSNNPQVVQGGRSGRGALQAYDGNTQRQVSLSLPGKQREIFVSFWVRVPPGTRFPGSTSGAGQFSSDSSWKFSWLMDTSRGFGSNDLYDICLPTYTGSGSGFQLAGNSFLASDRHLPTSWWSWNHWIRVSTWIRNPTTKTPGGVFEAVSQDKGYFRRNFGAPRDRLAHNDQQFDVFAVPGWIKGGGGSNVRPLYDDIYVSVGPGAAARVELANAASYEQATRIELTLVKSWASGQIETEIPRGIDLANQSWYVFVTDSEGRRNGTGIPVSQCRQCPVPPMLRVD